MHVNNIGCEAKINLYKGKNGIKITMLQTNHNHETSNFIYERENVELDEDDVELIVTLKEGNAKASQIARVLKQRQKKIISTQKVRNLIRKAIPNQNEENKEKLQTFLEKVDEEGGTIKTKEDPDETLNSIFITTVNMKKTYIATDAPLVQIDTSFSFESSEYKLVAVGYLNPTTNKSEVACVAFIAEESSENLEFVFRNFKLFCTHDPQIIMINKDFNEISVLKIVFPLAVILLCTFHVIKYIKLVISSAVVVVDKKRFIMDSFKALLYAKTEEDFNEKLSEFKIAIRGVEVRIGNSKNYVSLEAYFSKNWCNCIAMWARYKRKGLPLLGDHTSNRIERTFWTLKSSIKACFSKLPETGEAIMHIVQLCDD